ncbi:hypothetical protein CDIF29753_02667 [Clostridioides difficile]|nr:hypothetical protein CDIF29020_02736 [Clostridioides difficile]SHO37986.1 hypothetical protein CDIFFM120_02682C [Clostridioides difficile M120]AXU91152.1 hypothetical protein CDIF29747_02668 [Clostridioides difficile]OMK39639.1 hypothetical protein BER34_001278 [Clostridioides difficile]QPL00891.1 hypothetical protein CDIF101085_02668 [Clostridioides difficile]
MNFLVHETLFLCEVKYSFITLIMKKDYFYFKIDFCFLVAFNVLKLSTL